MTDLKSCPHCPEGKAIVGKDERYGWVRCNKCDGGTAGWHSATEKQQLRVAIGFWQNRPIEDELKSEIERLKKERDAVIVTCSDMGSLYAKMETKLVDAKDMLIDISQSAGNPDAKDACRIIVSLVRQAIKDIESEK